MSVKGHVSYDAWVGCWTEVFNFNNQMSMPSSIKWIAKEYESWFNQQNKTQTQSGCCFYSLGENKDAVH